MVGRHFDDTN
jgi:translation initiation factor 5B